METFLTLYKRTRTGTIQYWKISVEEQEDIFIRKESGKVGTSKPLVHLEPVKVGKNIGKANETSPEQQANLQASSDWAKKHDEGYKSLEDLKIGKCTVGSLGADDFYEYPGCGLTYMPLEYSLNTVLPEFNTDASGNVKPMLAPSKPFAMGDVNRKIKYPALLERKLDGIRATCVIASASSTPLFLSRSGKQFNSLHHLVEVMEPYFRTTYDGEFPVILDGELYRHGLTLEEINERAKKYRPETRELQYHMFDMPLVDAPQQERIMQAADIAHDIDPEEVFLVSSDAYLVESDRDVMEYHDEWVTKGYEGAMLKDPAGTYQPGQRSKFWQKVKMFDDDEYEIVGHILGQRGPEDLIFKCICKTAVKDYDPVFNVKVSGTLESKERLYSNLANTLGKNLTVKHFGLTKYGIPFLPIGKTIRDND